MSGNAHQRRAVRRFVAKILGLVVVQLPSESESPKKIFEQFLSWPAVAAVAPLLVGVGVGQVIAPIYVPDVLFALAAGLFLVKFFTWDVFLASPVHKVRASIVVVLPTLGLLFSLMYWNHKDVPFPFPWLYTMDSTDEIRLLIGIRDYPPEETNSTTYASMSPLYTLRLSVTKFEPRTGYEIEMAHVKDDWSSAETSNPVSKIVLSAGTTIIQFRGMSKDAQWNGYLLIRQKGKNFERREGISGYVVLPRKKKQIEMTEEILWDDKGKLSKIRYDRYKMTRKEKQDWGIPSNNFTALFSEE
jgi:hypothetical protein